MSEATGRVGKIVRCAICGHAKKPRGRAEPLGAYYCTPPWHGHGCEGYDQEPHVGSLWPGESEADFGYCSTCGWPFRDGKCTGGGASCAAHNGVKTAAIDQPAA